MAYLPKSSSKPFIKVTLVDQNVPLDIDFINLDDIASAPPVIPQAEYHVKIVEAVLKENKAKDGYYVSYRVVVQSGEHAGYSTFGMWSLKPTAAWRLKKDFKAMAYSPPDGKPHLADLIGFEGICLVQQEPVKDANGQATGEVRNSVKQWVAPLA